MAKTQNSHTNAAASAPRAKTAPKVLLSFRLSSLQSDAVLEYAKVTPAVRRQLSAPGQGLKPLEIAPRDLERLVEAITKAFEIAPNHRVRQQLMAAKIRCVKGMREET
jgi:hypothetical protein